MARRNDREAALHYFDFQTEDAGIHTDDIGTYLMFLKLIAIKSHSYKATSSYCVVFR